VSKLVYYIIKELCLVCIRSTELCNFTEQNPSSEDNSCSPSQEILFLVLNPNVCYSVHMRLPMDPILSQINSVHNLASSFLKFHLNIIFTATPTSPKWSLPFRFSNQNYICISHLSHACDMPHPSHPP